MLIFLSFIFLSARCYALLVESIFIFAEDTGTQFPLTNIDLGQFMESSREGEVCFRQNHIICTKNRQEKIYLQEQNRMKPNIYIYIYTYIYIYEFHFDENSTFLSPNENHGPIVCVCVCVCVCDSSDGLCKLS